MDYYTYVRRENATAKTQQAQPPSAPGTKTDWTRNPKVWGPHLWAYLHYAAINYPERPTNVEIEQMANWLCCLHVTIPCGKCRMHYKKHIDAHRHQLKRICSTNETLFNFLVDIHNKVNERHGKKQMSYAAARALYQ